NWSSTVTPSDTVPPAVIVLAGWVVITSLFSVAGTIVGEVDRKSTRLNCSHVKTAYAVVGSEEKMICSPLKLAAPLAATTEVVPAANLCVHSATPIVSYALSLHDALPISNWSSTVTPSDTVPPAVIVLAGWVVITSLFSVAGTIVGE